MKKQIKLAVCMMVKNEEKCLDTCLQSIASIADEINIVDTGSTDKTVEIAKSFGANIIHREWEDNFSKHRNQSIEMASEEMDWVMCIDADEKFILPEKGDFKEDLTKISEKYDCIAIDLIDMQPTMPEEERRKQLKERGIKLSEEKMQLLIKELEEKARHASPRIFKKGHIEYKGIIHNTAIVTGESIFYPHSTIEHYGYAITEETKERIEEKNERRERLLLKRLQENGEDWEAMFYLAQHFSVLNNQKKSIYWGEKYIASKNKQGEDFKTISFFTLIKDCMAINLLDKAQAYINQGFSYTNGDCLDLAYVMVQLGRQIKDVDMIVLGADRFLKAFTAIQNNQFKTGQSTHFNYNFDALGFVIYHQGMCELQKGVNSFKNLGVVNQKLSGEFKDKILEAFKEDMKKELKLDFI